MFTARTSNLRRHQRSGRRQAFSWCSWWITIITIRLQVVGMNGAKIGPSILLKGAIRRDADDQTIAVDHSAVSSSSHISGGPFGCTTMTFSLIRL